MQNRAGRAVERYQPYSVGCCWSPLVCGAPVSPDNLKQESLRILQIRSVKSLGKPIVDRREQVMGLFLLALLLP